MSEVWKNHTMISIRTARKFKKNSFVFWYKWITGALNNNTVKNY